MKKSIMSSFLLLALSAGMLVACNNKKEPTQTIISLEDGELVLSNEPTSDGLVYERDLDGEGFSIKDYVGNSTNVVIPKKFEGKPVKRIQSYAFQHKYLQTLTIPDTVETIEDYAFIENDEFNTIKVSGKYFFLKNNALYRHVEGDKKQRTLVYALPKLTGQFIVDEQVVGITKGAFQSTGLTIVNLNADLVNTHFQNLFGLSAEAIPDNMKQVCLTGGNVKDYAFTGVKALSSLVVYDPVETIGNKAFFNCSDLTTVLIPDSVTSIGEQAFANCANLKEIRIGNSASPKLANLGNNAFAGCARVEGYVKLGIKYLGNPQCENLIALEAKNLLMESLSFEDDTKFICSEAFKGCAKLETLDLGKVISIGDKAFANCASLQDVVLPNSLKTFGNQVFDGSKVLLSSKTQVTTSAYYLKTKDGERKALIAYKSNANNKLTIDADTEWIDTYAINATLDAASIKKFETASDKFEVSDDFSLLFDSKMKILYGSAKAVEINQEDIDLSNLVEIKSYGLAKATIDGFEMPQKLKTIGDHAFYGFAGKNLSEYKFILPETVVSAGDHAFESLAGFTELVLNDGLLVLGEYACANISTMTTALYFPASLSFVGANVFEESTFSAIKVAANSAPASWDPNWLGSYLPENVIYNAVR